MLAKVNENQLTGFPDNLDNSYVKLTKIKNNTNKYREIMINSYYSLMTDNDISA